MSDRRCDCCGAEAVGEFALGTLNGARGRTELLCAVCWWVHTDLPSVVELQPIRTFDDGAATPG